jgi:hypothetical protein
MTEQEFVKKSKRQIVLSAFLMLAGAAILLLTTENRGNFLSAYRFGVAGGLMGVGLARALRNILLLKNKERRQKELIKQTDERNILIGRKALGAGYYGTILLLGAAPLYAPPETAETLFAILGVSVFLYAAAYWFFQKKM